MELLPPELLCSITQYTGDTFPTDPDIIRMDYERLLDYVITKNYPGRLKALLEIEECKNPDAIRWAANYGHSKCLKLLIDAKCPMTEDAIEFAAMAGQEKCLKMLIAAKCPMTDYAIWWTARNGYT